MVDNKWLEGLRAEYRYNLLCADLHARIRDLRAVMARRRVWCERLALASVVLGWFIVGFAVGVCLVIWLR